MQIRRYDIIYQVTDDLKAALEGMLKPEKQEKELGRAPVQQVFVISRMGPAERAAACWRASIQRDARVRLIRDSRVIVDPPRSFKRGKDDAREVREGFNAASSSPDTTTSRKAMLEAYKIEEIAEHFRVDSRWWLVVGQSAERSRVLTKQATTNHHPLSTHTTSMSSRRTEEAAEAIREVVSMAILAELSDPRVRDVTVTYVEVSRDLRYAKVHVSVMGDEGRKS